MSLIQTILSHAAENLTVYRGLTGAGVGLSAFLVLANLGAGRFGVLPMVRDKNRRKQMGVSLALAVKQWEFFFDKAATPVVASQVLASALFLGASFYTPGVGHLSHDLAFWLRMTAASSLLPLPYTLLMMLPPIKQLKALCPYKEFSPQQEATAQRYLDQWAYRHQYRIAIFTIPVILGTIALLAG